MLVRLEARGDISDLLSREVEVGDGGTVCENGCRRCSKCFITGGSGSTANQTR